MVWPFTSNPTPDPKPAEIHPDSVDLEFRHVDEPWPVEGRERRKFQRLVVACDGTWQSVDSLTKADESDPDPSNVSRFYHSLRLSKPGNDDPIFLKNGDIVHQRAKYISGVGTNGWWDKYVGGAFGSGVEVNILKGYKWLCDNYQQGDEIFLLGFSRGAFTARSLGGFIQDVGLLRVKDDKEFKKIFTEIFTAYKNPGPWDADVKVRSEKRTAIFRKYMETKGYSHPLYFNVPIKGMGVWDTVGALGIPQKKDGVVEWVKKKFDWDWNRQYEFHNPTLGLGVKNAFHALALDEQRYSFRPTLWTWPQQPPAIPEELFDPKNGEHLRTQALATKASEPFLMQCWFPGVHIDIGGGTSSGKYPAFSDLTLLWMMRRFNDKTYLELLEFQPKIIDGIIKDAWNRKPYQPKPEPAGILRRITAPVTSLFGWASSSTAKAPSTSTSTTTDATRDSGITSTWKRWVNAEISNRKGSAVTALSGLVPRSPGAITDFDPPLPDDFPTSGGPSNVHFLRGEYIHAVARLRKENNIPLPDSLQGWEVTNGPYSWVKRKGGEIITEIPEYTPGGDEQRLIAGEDDSDKFNNFYSWTPTQTAVPEEDANKKTV